MFAADATLEITWQPKGEDAAHTIKYDVTTCAITDSSFIKFDCPENLPLAVDHITALLFGGERTNSNVKLLHESEYKLNNLSLDKKYAHKKTGARRLEKDMAALSQSLIDYFIFWLRYDLGVINGACSSFYIKLDDADKQSMNPAILAELELFYKRVKIARCKKTHKQPLKFIAQKRVRE